MNLFKVETLTAAIAVAVVVLFGLIGGALVATLNEPTYHEPRCGISYAGECNG
ncbi:MAG: hypothetical protein GY906_23140 [bacterium]|nr:hypothetical protein [bacterium]